MFRIGIGVCWIFIVYVGNSQGISEANRFDPRIISKNVDERGAPLFHGVIGENEKVVVLDEPLTAKDDDEMGEAKLICGYKIHKREHNRIPFVIRVTDRVTGLATIKLSAKAKNINYEKRKEYKFSISAYDCPDGARRYSERAWVIVRVTDKDESIPKFDKDAYIIELEEKRMYDNVLKVSALDLDRSPEFGEICDYKILTPNEPFSIDSTGTIKTTRKLDYSKRTNHILAVVAEDCAHRQSAPVMVNIKVLKTCGWHGFPSHVDYLPGSGRKKLAPSAALKVCGKTCNITKVAVRIILETKHIGKGCDRDTYSIKSQRHLCSASEGSVDLLPSPSDATSWTKDLPTDDGHMSDRIFGFDGKINAVEVPMGQFNHHLKEHFTMATWMKHERGDDDNRSHHHPAKEHILCMSDAKAMSRHHYSWFVHGDKLVLLKRREASDADNLEDFKPAEWRWHIPQLNDNQWHHYAISMGKDSAKNRDEASLYIDGKMLIPDANNPVIVEDWALHPTHKVNSTRLMVGACWQGADQKLDMFFRGYLAGLYILNGKTESYRVIKCLTNCKETLEFHSLQKMDSGMTVSFNSDMTEVSITAQSLAEVEKIVREVSYVNARSYPTPGRRALRVETGVVALVFWRNYAKTLCPKDGEPTAAPSVADVNSYVMVLSSEDPVISLSAYVNRAWSVEDLAKGQKIFSTVELKATLEPEEDMDSKLEEYETKKLNAKSLSSVEMFSLESTSYKSEDPFLLDKCTIRADPPMNLKVERLTFPNNLMDMLSMTEQQKMDSTETNEGVVITGLNKIEHYELVLREIHYYHEDADKLSTRHFYVKCSTQDDRFTSNELKMTISAIHEEKIAPVHVAHAMKAESVEVARASVAHNPVHALTAAAAPSMGMVAIIVVCVGFLLFMIILGVIRIRAAHNRTRVVTVDERQEEMEWDNTALNITVNPLEQEVLLPQQNIEYDRDVEVMHNLRDDEDDSDDDGSSFHDDLESSEEEAEKVKDRDLEWDDSTLSF
ncbi:calsyntenin-1-like [Liolophura sinensis]|uniref:calsyntenin-1-like n=1 Tax=Liolophura sinensis TaxID=3198878 RepID=UPI003158DF22